MAAIETRHEEALGDLALRGFESGPQGVTFQSVDRADTDLPAFSPLRHTLGRFVPVEVIAVDTAIADADTLSQVSSEGHVDRREPPGHGQ
jgi:hypothetical protein